MTMAELRQQKFMHMRLGRGGYAYGYKIIDESGKQVAHKSIHLEHSKAKEVVTYMLGDQQFGSAAEFLDAYNKKVEADRRDAEWEAAAS